MYEQFGASVDGRRVTFRVFFPDTRIEESAYVRGGLPKIARLQVVGTFQAQLGSTNWNTQTGPELTLVPHERGLLYQCALAADLQDDFYEYKYFLTFENHETRWCADPCAKYGGSENDNSGFAVGGTDVEVRPLDHRLPPKDLVIYELMTDDFTAEFRGGRAPFDAIHDKIPYLQELGVNAVEFLPWTSWPGSEFNWGYEPTGFFAVEYRYMNDPTRPEDKLVRFKRLINALHDAGIHVIMDGVFNHASDGGGKGEAFAYQRLYQNAQDSPFVGHFSGGDYFLDLDFGNACTQDFILDVCQYWIGQYQIDGIRFDYTRGFFGTNAQLGQGIVRLLDQVDSYCKDTERENVSLMLEHLTDNPYDAIDDINKSLATGCWYEPFFWAAQDFVEAGHVNPQIMRAMNAGKDFRPGKRPVTYIENHDHRTLTVKAGGRDRWWRTQPFAIALLTISGSVLIHNGQEFGEYHNFPEHGQGDGRVAPRPLRWASAADSIGTSLRGVYARLISIRNRHPALRSRNFYPESDAPHFNEHGYGLDADKSVAIYHRWEDRPAGGTDLYIVVVNFSPFDRWVDIPFTRDGMWRDLLNGNASVNVTGARLQNQQINGNWGRVYHFQG
jgi:1,4-alpha-glucan branching enzyme